MEVPKIYPRSSEINFKAIRSFDWEGDVLTVTDGIVNAFRDATDLQIIGHYQVDCTELREFLEAKRAGKDLRVMSLARWLRAEDTVGVCPGERLCSNCGYILTRGCTIVASYCPHCGAKMEVSSDG